MAAIDHTIIAYKNGRLARDESYFEDDENGDYDINKWHNVPEWIHGITVGDYIINWGRDADLRYIEDKKNNVKIEEFETFPYWDGYTYNERFIHLKPRWFAGWLERAFPKRELTTYVVRFKTDSFEVFNLITPTHCILYVFVGEDSYVLVGGYGHMANPYTHFYHRGYGVAFENRMSKECYEWTCEEFNDTVSKCMTKTYDEEDEFSETYNDFLRYKDYFKMTEDERDLRKEFKDNDEIA